MSTAAGQAGECCLPFVRNGGIHLFGVAVEDYGIVDWHDAVVFTTGNVTDYFRIIRQVIRRRVPTGFQGDFLVPPEFNEPAAGDERGRYDGVDIKGHVYP